MLRIGLITEELGWHSTRLIEAFQNHSCQVTDVALPQCSFKDNRLCLPQFNNQLPAGVFVRGIPAGSLETVTFYLSVLHSLKASGVFVYNDASMIERSVDKVMTSFLLNQADISTPPTWAFASWEQADQFVKSQLKIKDEKLVLKPVFGSQGKDLQLISDYNDWQKSYEEFYDSQMICYLQSFIQSEDASDMRVFIIGGLAVAVMKRKGPGWINNVACGAECQLIDLDQDVMEIAEKAVTTLGLFYAGVDLIRDVNGKLWVIEINSIPAWKGLQSVTPIDIADRLSLDFLRSLHING